MRNKLKIELKEMGNELLGWWLVVHLPYSLVSISQKLKNKCYFAGGLKLLYEQISPFVVLTGINK